MSTALPFAVGMVGASAARRRPRMRLTRSVAPASSAPVLPAQTKPSALPSRSRVSPTVREESFFCLKAVAGSSQISTTSDASAISTPAGSALQPHCCAAFRISALRPARMMSAPYFSCAISAPFTGARGAKSPPIASTMIFMRSLLSRRSMLPRAARRCAQAHAQPEARSLPACRP